MPLNAPGYSGGVTDHFDGRCFHNASAREHDLLDAMRWMLTRDAAQWPAWVEIAAFPPPPRRVQDGPVRVTFVNHSTVLLQVAGLNILTDPVWSYRCSPFSWAGPRRHTNPGVRFRDLPPVDLVLVSHNHYDHMDIPTLVRIHDEHHPRFVTTLGNSLSMAGSGIGGVDELDWWESIEVGGARVTCTPTEHFSGRGTADRNMTLWGSFVIEAGGSRVYFAGDTGYGEFFAEVRRRCGEPRLALIPIGAYEPRWFMRPVHLTPDDAVQAHLDLGAERSVAIHHGTFKLADDGMDQPVVDLRAALSRRGIDASRFVVLENGDALW